MHRFNPSLRMQALSASPLVRMLDTVIDRSMASPSSSIPESLHVRVNDPGRVWFPETARS